MWRNDGSPCGMPAFKCALVVAFVVTLLILIWFIDHNRDRTVWSVVVEWVWAVL